MVGGVEVVTTPFRIMVIDYSGRGHATADLFVRTNPEALVHYVPGSAAIRNERVVSAPHVPLDDLRAMTDYARRERIELVYVSHPVALANGFADAFREIGLPVVGPDRRSARLESSKVETKALFREFQIPSPEYVDFADVGKARRYVRECKHAVVVKSDGLTGGNGAYVCDGPEDALSAIDEIMVERRFGASGDRITIERRCYGPELSFFALVDGEDYLTLPMSADYPKSDDGNLGVDSAGMGALCPHPLGVAGLEDKIERHILQPLMSAIQQRQLDYRGIIYLGCMLVDGDPLLLEINARMGDPEAQVVYPKIDSDFVALSRAMIDGTLHRHRIHLDERSYCAVSATQGPTTSGLPGWPYGDHDVGHLVRGFEEIDPSQAKLFIGEATLRNGRVVTDGGRIANVCGFADDLDAAADNAYANVDKLAFEGIRYRTDIGRTMPWDMTGSDEDASS